MKRDDWFGSVCAVLIVLGAAVGGVALVYTGVRDVDLQHHAQMSWQSIQGHVLKTTVSQGARFKGKAAILNLFYQEYRVEVVYTFTVDGRTFSSRQLAPPAADSDRGRQGWAEITAAQFNPLDPCEVFYDPDDPSHSYLLRGTTSNVYGRILIGLFLVLVCGVLLPGVYVMDRAAQSGLLPRPRGLAPAEQHGWSELLPASGEWLRSSVRWRVILAAVCWDAGLGATCWHYFVEGVRPLRWGFVDLGLLIVAVGIALMLSFMTYRDFATTLRGRRTLFPARVYLQTDRLTPGTRLVIGVEQSARAAVLVKKCTAALLDPATDTKVAIVQLADQAVTAEEPLLGYGELVLAELAEPVLARIDVLTRLDDGSCAMSSFTFWSPALLSVPQPEEEGGLNSSVEDDKQGSAAEEIRPEHE